MQSDLERVLAARESRWNARNELACAHPSCAVVSLTICLPHAYRVSPVVVGLFPGVCAGVKAYLTSRGVAFPHSRFLSGSDGDAALWVAEGSAVDVKQLCVEAEERLPAGRMLDIDVMDGSGRAVDRAAVGLPPRRCLVCENRAAVCSARRTHSPDALDAAIADLLVIAREGYGRHVTTVCGCLGK